MVGRDDGSHQTPHYGYLQGDGDFVFKFPDDYDPPLTDEVTDKDRLITLPAVALPDQTTMEQSKIERAKELLSDEKRRIAFHDMLTQETRSFLATTSNDQFPLQGKWSDEEFHERRKRYETAIRDLLEIYTLGCYWGT